MIPDEVAERFDLISDEYAKDPWSTIQKLISNYALSQSFLEKEGLTADYQEYCAEIMATSV